MQKSIVKGSTLVQPTVVENMITRKKLPTDLPHAKKLPSCVYFKFIVRDMQLLTVVENPFFLNLQEEMKAEIRVPCHSHLTNLVLK